MKVYLGFLLIVIFLVMNGDGKNLAGNFVRKSLDIQFGIAKIVSGKINSSIILFTVDKEKFKNATVLVVDNYRYLRAVTGEFGVLSEAAQATFGTTNTYSQYLGVRESVSVTIQDVTLTF
jgi:hypothetical protein